MYVRSGDRVTLESIRLQPQVPSLGWSDPLSPRKESWPHRWISSDIHQGGITKGLHESSLLDDHQIGLAHGFYKSSYLDGSSVGPSIISEVGLGNKPI